MVQTYCIRCSKTFFRDSEKFWKRLCLQCYIDNKQQKEQLKYNAGKRHLEEMRIYLDDRIETLERENHRLNKQVITLSKIIRRRETIPQKMVKRLISLCHPDKHDNNKMSHEVTQWLLEQR